MAKTERELFDGKPVIEFHDENDRRKFLSMAAKVGVGGALAFAGVACTDDGGGGGNGSGAGPGNETPSEPNQASPGEGDTADVPSGDIDILNYALTLEYLETDFYTQGTDGNTLSGRELEIVEAIRAHEAAHVKALSTTIEDLGGQPVKQPKFKYPAGTFDSRDKFLQTASTFEELGVTAYHGQVGNIQTPDLLAAAAAIAGVESRHAAVLARLIEGEAFPAPFEKAQPMEAVLKAAKPFIQS
ncbi:MAG: ferritin-like domain-containing protein [Actinomycetota bacterium]|nr:ferritin-like domain-containing protein [Actinomycetota bacterium]